MASNLQIVAGRWVQVLHELDGIKQGPSVEHGDGQPGEIPAGGICEVADVEPVTGLLTLLYDLTDSGPLQPYRVAAHAFRSEVVPVRRPGLPDIEIPEMP